MKKCWFVYMIKCGDGTLYTGITNDLEQRIKNHNRGRGSRYTRSRRPVRLVYVEEFSDKSSAMKREALIKSWRRNRKLLLIQGDPVKGQRSCTVPLGRK